MSSRRGWLCLGLASASLALVATALPAAGATRPSPVGEPSYIKCTIWGNAGNNVLRGTPGDDIICGQGGNDTIVGGGGRDVLYGGPGNDTITGGDTTAPAGLYGDEIYAGPGNDIVNALGGNDHIEGGSGADTIHAGAGDDYVLADFLLESWGESGSDTVFGGPGNDSIRGGGGDDFIDGGSNTVQDMIEAGSGDDVVRAPTGSTWSNVWNGDGGNDLLVPDPLRGSPLGNSVTGGAGSDVAILVNGMADGFTAADYPDSVADPVSNRTGCNVSVPLTNNQETKVKNWQIQCAWLGPVNLQTTFDGHVSIGTDFYKHGDSRSAGSWRDFARGRMSSQNGDLCVCDPPGLSLLNDLID